MRWIIEGMDLWRDQWRDQWTDQCIIMREWIDTSICETNDGKQIPASKSFTILSLCSVSSNRESARPDFINSRKKETLRLTAFCISFCFIAASFGWYLPLNLRTMYYNLDSSYHSDNLVLTWWMVLQHYLPVCKSELSFSFQQNFYTTLH